MSNGAGAGTASGSFRTLLVFTRMVIAASFVFAWLRFRSGSVWTVVLFHASHNLLIQQIFDPPTEDRGITEYVTTEFVRRRSFAHFSLVSTDPA